MKELKDSETNNEYVISFCWFLKNSFRSEYYVTDQIKQHKCKSDTLKTKKNCVDELHFLTLITDYVLLFFCEAKL